MGVVTPPLALLRGHLPRRGRQELSLTIQIPKRPLPTGRFLRKTEEITTLQQPELLAPAGSLETLKYAVMYGADAVYCALPEFGMRAAPVNLTVGELHEAASLPMPAAKRSI